jgi:type I site-specific restriction endonuclease
MDICDLFITPAIQEAGWDSMTQIRREVTQGVDAADEREQLERLVRQLIEKGGSKLWEADA